MADRVDVVHVGSFAVELRKSRLVDLEFAPVHVAPRQARSPRRVERQTCLRSPTTTAPRLPNNACTMPAAVSPHRRADSSGPDDLDKLLDYDNAVDDFLRDIPIGGNDSQNNITITEQPRDEDQEVQVKRKRRPVPKLDEDRCVSDAK